MLLVRTLQEVDDVAFMPSPYLTKKTRNLLREGLYQYYTP